MNGASSMPYLDGSNPYLANYLQVNDFANPEERSWQLRYDFDLRSVGVPGLSFMTRYVNGDHIRLANGDEGKEWERDIELKYVVQSGRFKDLSLRLRNATYRTDFERSARDETSAPDRQLQPVAVLSRRAGTHAGATLRRFRPPGRVRARSTLRMRSFSE